jgi:hypothetical protein
METAEEHSTDTMNHSELGGAPVDSSAPPARHGSAPVVVLLLLSPLIGEVLFGATRITTLFILLPQIGTWGCATLLIREMVRRRSLGWTAVLILGLALAVAEECLLQQTSFAPLVGADPNHPYGRALGVNWVYFLWALGYESIWIVLLPIQLVELLFSERRDEPWLGNRGLVLASLVFVLASFVAWYIWTQLFLPRYFPELAYRVPLASIAIASAACVALAITALSLRQAARPAHGTNRSVPGSWLVGLVAFVLGLQWFGLIFLAYGAVPRLPSWIPLVSGLALAAGAFGLIASWYRRAGWTDSHRLALVFGGMVASMLAGFPVFLFGGALAIDWIGKVVLNVVAIILLKCLARRIQSVA